VECDCEAECVEGKIAHQKDALDANMNPLDRKAAFREANARRNVLATWRGVDLTDAERASRRTEKSLSELMPDLLSSLRLEQRQADAEIMRVWNHLLDPRIVAHAHPTGLWKGTLFVTVDSSVWLAEIVRYRYKEILHQLQSSFGKERIARISFRAG
jgi:predicted nucleic acid-binding Zn ribbon protein